MLARGTGIVAQAQHGMMHHQDPNRDQSALPFANWTQIGSVEDRLQHHLNDAVEVKTDIAVLKNQVADIRSLVKWVGGIISGVGVALIIAIVFAALKISQ